MYKWTNHYNTEENKTAHMQDMLFDCLTKGQGKVLEVHNRFEGCSIKNTLYIKV